MCNNLSLDTELYYIFNIRYTNAQKIIHHIHEDYGGEKKSRILSTHKYAK